MDFYNLDDLLLMSGRDVHSSDDKAAAELSSMNAADSSTEPPGDMSFERNDESEETQKSDDFDYDFANLEPMRRDRAATWHGRARDAAAKDGASPGPMSGGDVSEKLFNDDLAVVRRKVATRRNAWGNQSYADLICKAIESSPEQRLTLSQIYNWMVQNVPFFTDKGDSNSSAGWKNSIRHNLSLHSRFKRVQNEGTGKSSWWVINTEARTTRAPRRRAATMDPQAYEKRRHGRGASRRLNSALNSDAHHGSGGILSALAVEQPNPAAFLLSPPCDSSLELSPMSFTLSPQDFRTRTGSNASSIGVGGGRLSPIQAEPDMYADTRGGAVSWMDNNCRISGYQTSPLVAGYQTAAGGGGNGGHADSLAETLGKSLTGIFDSGAEYASSSSTPVALQNGNRQSSPASHHGGGVVGTGSLSGYIPVPTSCYLLNQQHPSLYRVGMMSSNAGGGGGSLYGNSSVNSMDYYNSPSGCHASACSPVGLLPANKVDVPMICIGGNISGNGLNVNDTMAGGVQSFGTMLLSHNRQPLEQHQMKGGGHPQVPQYLQGGQRVMMHQGPAPPQLTHLPGSPMPGLQHQILLRQQEGLGQQVPRQQLNQMQWDLMNLMQQQQQQQQQQQPLQDCQKSQIKPLTQPAIDRQALIRLLSEKPHLKEKIKQLLAEKSQLRGSNNSPLNSTQQPTSNNSSPFQSQSQQLGASYPPNWPISTTQPQTTILPPVKTEQSSTGTRSDGNDSNALLSNHGGSEAEASLVLPNDLDFDFHPSKDIECDINQIINYDSICFGDSFDFAELDDEGSASGIFDDIPDMLN